MTAMMNVEWGPYNDVSEARPYLLRFADRVCDPQIGVCWTANGKIYPLRASHRDGLGFGDTLILQWSPAPAPLPRAPTRFWGKARAFIADVLTAEGNAQIAQSRAQMAMGTAMSQVFNRMSTSHRVDGLGVVLDIVCIGLSLGLVSTGIGFIAGIALAGGTMLLLTDSTAYALELAGEDEGAEKFKSMTEKWRIIATVATLPDGLVGGWSALRELSEINDALSLEKATAVAAGNLGRSTATLDRAARYRQIAERAKLRSQIRTEQIRASITHEIIPRGAGFGSLGLLVNEEVANDDSKLHEFLGRLQLHCVAVHK